MASRGRDAFRLSDRDIEVETCALMNGTTGAIEDVLQAAHGALATSIAPVASGAAREVGPVTGAGKDQGMPARTCGLGAGSCEWGGVRGRGGAQHPGGGAKRNVLLARLVRVVLHLTP